MHRRACLAVLLGACGAPQATTRELEPAAAPPGSGARAIPASTSPTPAASTSPAPAASSDCPAEYEPYQPLPASDRKVRLPEVPAAVKKPIRVGDAYTVWGATYFFRSQVHRAEIRGKAVTIEGFIVKTNLPDVPRCAVHRAGQADPPNCRAPVPAFWLGDRPGDAASASIKVMGWASNYAQIFDAIRTFDSGKGDAEYIDSFWGISIPNPLPAVGAKVRVIGNYGSTFSMSSTGLELDPYQGVLTYAKIVELAPAPELATLPGVRRNTLR